MSTADELRSVPIFDGLSEDQLGQLAAAGDRIDIVPGEELWLEGHPADYWWAVVDGAIDLVRRMGREHAVVGQLMRGRWAGGFKAWDEHGVYLATGRGVKEGWVLRLPATELRRLSTEWFPFGGHLIQGLYGTARSIEATARQRESLVALGTLAAGLAHEINNPAAAASRSVAELETASAAVLAALRALAESGISAAQFTEMDNLRQELMPRTDLSGPVGLPVPLDPLAMADREDELSTWLADHDVERDWLLAEPLAAAGADLAWCERVAAALPGAALEPSLEWVVGALSVSSLLGEVRESTGRISKLIGAVRSYSQMDRASLQQFDLTEGLESTLIMLGQQLTGIDVVRDYSPDVPAIEGYAGELNQVWTNVIDNAIDAMGGSGTLRLSTSLSTGSSGGSGGSEIVVVEVADSGSGVTPEVAARAFDAFFTTKDVGAGAGLGLDIARRIVVERHGGEITIESGPPVPGSPFRTVLRVRLPIRLAGIRPS